MTVNDENSVYVGGLPYDCTENELRDAFEYYGAVVDAKIINDREVGGKCYGFVTFTNPRAAVNAIEDMNGKTIGGRVVRVNEVHSRGGRQMFHRDNYRRDSVRDSNWDRGRNRDREHVDDRERYRGRANDHFRDHDREKEMDLDHGRDIGRGRNRVLDRSRDQEYDEDHLRDAEHSWDDGHERDWDHDRDIDKAKDNDGGGETDKDQLSKKRKSNRFSDHRSRESSSDPSDFDHEVKEQIEKAIQKHEELQNEITMKEEKIKEKQLLISEKQKKCQKLEDALAAARKLTSQHHSTVTKIERCYIQTQRLAESLKSYEKELQVLVDTARGEVDDSRSLILSRVE